jgi:hypothetical protein
MTQDHQTTHGFRPTFQDRDHYLSVMGGGIAGESLAKPVILPDRRSTWGRTRPWVIGVGLCLWLALRLAGL